jgi:hypothetical protein
VGHVPPELADWARHVRTQYASLIIPLYEAERLLVEAYRLWIADNPARAAREWVRLFKQSAMPDIYDEEDGLSIE